MNVVNWWSYVILIVAVWFFETHCTYNGRPTESRRPYVVYRTEPFSTVLNNNPVFKVTPFFDANISQTAKDTATVAAKMRIGKHKAFECMHGAFSNYPYFKVTVLVNVKTGKWYVESSI